MNITTSANEPVDNQIKVTLTVAAADVDAAIKKAYKDAAAKYNFQGFRKGKAPRPVIDNMLGKDAIRAQATNEILNEAEPLMLEELDIVPISEVSYGTEPVLAEDGKDYVVEATIDVRPEAGLSSYDAPSIKMPPEEATDAEVDFQINQLLSYQVSFKDIEDERAAVEGDYVAVDIDNVDGAARFAGKNRMLVLDGNNIPAELQDAIIGMNVGEEKEVTWTESHGEGEHAHEHTYTVKVKLNAIREQVVPELDDDFAKKNFGFDTADEVRAAIKEEIDNDKKSMLPGLKEDRVVIAMGERLELDELPDNYVSQLFQELAQEFLSQLERQGASLDMFLKARNISMDAFLADLRAQAAERARQSLALDAVARNLGFEATDEDVEEEFARAGADDPEALMAEWKKEGRLPAIRDSIKRTKALKWLVENADVTVVDEMAEAVAKVEAADEAEVEAEAADEAADAE